MGIKYLKNKKLKSQYQTLKRIVLTAFDHLNFFMILNKTYYIIEEKLHVRSYIQQKNQNSNFHILEDKSMLLCLQKKITYLLFTLSLSTAFDHFWG